MKKKKLNEKKLGSKAYISLFLDSFGLRNLFWSEYFTTKNVIYNCALFCVVWPDKDV